MNSLQLINEISAPLVYEVSKRFKHAGRLWTKKENTLRGGYSRRHHSNAAVELCML